MSVPGGASRRWPVRVLWIVGAAAVLFAAYGHVLTRGPFGINDDYQFLYRTQAGHFDPWHNELMGMGRPLNAWGVQLAYGPCAGQVARLVWLRAVSLAGIGAFGWMTFLVLARLRYGRGVAATVGVLAALTPACGIYAAYASGVFVPVALCCALGAGWLLVGGPPDWRRDLAAGGLIVLACANWQAAAPLAMFPVLADAWARTGARREPLPPDTAPWWRPWLVAGLAVGGYGALCVLIARSGAVSPGGVARLAVANDPGAKARFLLAILRTGVTSWARLQVGPWEQVVGVGTTVACLLAVPVWHGGRWRPMATAGRAVLAAFMVLLSVAPLLAAREDNGAFRSLVCLYVTLIFLGVLGVRRLLVRAPDWTRAVLAVASMAATVGAARYHVWHGLVEPSVREYVGLRDEVRRQFPGGMPARLVYLVPPYTPPAAGRLTPSWEYGLTSSTFWWVTRPFLQVLFANALPDKPLPPDPQISFREAGNTGVPVLQSLPALLREPGEWRDDPRWGHVRAFRGGWLYSPWFGYLNVGSFPAVRHHLLGDLLYNGQESDGRDLWFYHAGVGSFVTSKAVYPHLFLGERKRWAALSDDPPLQVHLSDDATHETLPYPP